MTEGMVVRSAGLAGEFTDAELDELAMEEFMRNMEDALYRDIAEELERLEALEGDAAVQAAVQSMACSNQGGTLHTGALGRQGIA